MKFRGIDRMKFLGIKKIFWSIKRMKFWGIERMEFWIGRMKFWGIDRMKIEGTEIKNLRNFGTWQG